MDCSLPGFSVHEILQARILVWVTILFSRRSSWPRDWTLVSSTAGRYFTIWASREPHNRVNLIIFFLLLSFYSLSHVQLFWDPMDCSSPRLLHPWDFPGKNTGVGFHLILQGILPIQGSSLSFLHCRWNFCHWASGSYVSQSICSN